MSAKPPSRAQDTRGRGAQSAQLSRRFNLPEREADGDWRDQAELVDGPVDKLRTTVTEEHPRTIIAFNKSPDIGFDRSINAYRGCEHGCAYCYARPSRAFLDLSPGLDFESRLFAKPDAPRLLRETLARKGYRPAPIAMGTNTDPYQPIEARYRLTRQVLDICLETNHPVTITTKSDRVLHDLDLLQELARRNLTWVSISVTSMDPRISGTLEPRAAAPAKRIAALRRLSESGVPAHVSIAPIIPSITDHELEEILMQAGAAGVDGASWIMLRLPNEVAPIFREWLDAHYPDRAEKVMSIIHSLRGGKDNEAQFFKRFRPDGPWAQLFRDRFRIGCRRAGIRDRIAQLDCSRFEPPALPGAQLQLL